MRDADDPVDARARDDVRRLSKDDARAIVLAIARQHDEKDVKVITGDENETTMARVEDARAAVERGGDVQHALAKRQGGGERGRESGDGHGARGEAS